MSAALAARLRELADIRFGPEDGVRIALRALADHLDATAEATS